MQGNKITTDTTYIIASCKKWHQASFKSICQEISANWHYVSNNSELEETLSRTKPRYIFFLHWNWIVPDSIWMKNECVCFHMTDVPYGRGGSPLQNLILAGHTQTILTALKMVKEIDAGPIYTKKLLNLNGTAQEIYIEAGNLSLEIIKWIINNKPEPIPQEGEVIIFNRRKPAQSCLPNNGSLHNVYDFIRMLDADGYPNAFINHGDYKIKFKEARYENNKIIAKAEIIFNSKN